MSESSLKGSCLCGEARYVVHGAPVRFFHCHCSRCRKASGTGHASNLFVKGSLEWESGEEMLKSYKLPEAERFRNTFCQNCGGRLPVFIEQAGIVFIPAGSLDQEPGFMPQARIFVGSRTQWSCNKGPITEFEEYPS